MMMARAESKKAEHIQVTATPMNDVQISYRPRYTSFSVRSSHNHVIFGLGSDTVFAPNLQKLEPTVSNVQGKDTTTRTLAV